MKPEKSQTNINMTSAMQKQACSYQAKLHTNMLNSQFNIKTTLWIDFISNVEVEPTGLVSRNIISIPIQKVKVIKTTKL